MLRAPEIGDVSSQPTNPVLVSIFTSNASRVLANGTETDAPKARVSAHSSR